MKPGKPSFRSHSGSPLFGQEQFPAKFQQIPADVSMSCRGNSCAWHHALFLYFLYYQNDGAAYELASWLLCVMDTNPMHQKQILRPLHSKTLQTLGEILQGAAEPKIGWLDL